MNNITIELCAEDRARIDTLNSLLTALCNGLGQTIYLLEGINIANEAKGLVETKVVETEITMPEPDNTPDTVAETPAEATQEVAEEQTPPAEEIVQNEPTVTKPDILAKVIELCGKGKKAEAKDIITAYADSVSDLPESALTEVWDKLTALEG